MTDIIMTTHGGAALVRLNRPQKLNALNANLMAELNAALDCAEEDDTIGAIVITGDARAFAAGADIAEMAKLPTFAAAMKSGLISKDWERVCKCQKPVIAAVGGFALGGGCELAMMCDFIIAADTAKFSQPEITIGTTPGAGGSQRMARAAGKAKTMEMCLTGRMMDAEEAERCGIVARIVPADKLEEEAIKTAQKIASFSQPVVRMIKAAVNAAFETTLNAGVKQERQLFHATFALQDRTEGMRAFTEKRPPKFQNK
ncbi:MAG: enoyl-CoA hydratase-related protein [Gammaproteobacteria bacterium]